MRSAYAFRRRDLLGLERGLRAGDDDERGVGGDLLGEQVDRDRPRSRSRSSRDFQRPSPGRCGRRPRSIEGSPWPVVKAIFGLFPSRSRIRAEVTASSPLKLDSNRSASGSNRWSCGTSNRSLLRTTTRSAVSPSPYSITTPAPLRDADVGDALDQGLVPRRGRGKGRCSRAGPSPGWPPCTARAAAGPGRAAGPARGLSAEEDGEGDRPLQRLELVDRQRRERERPARGSGRAPGRRTGRPSR